MSAANLKRLVRPSRGDPVYAAVCRTLADCTRLLEAARGSSAKVDFMSGVVPKDRDAPALAAACAIFRALRHQTGR